MKVFMINSVCGILSTGRICTDILDVLHANGNECLIAYGRGFVPQKYTENTYLIQSKIGLNIDALKTRIFDNAGFNSTSATKRLIRQIKEYDPDVIHLHNLHGYYLNLEVLFNYLASTNKPVIWTLHDVWPITGHCAIIGECDKWMHGCSACARLREYPASILLDNSKKNYEKKKHLFTSQKNLTLVVPSRWLADILKLSFLKTTPTIVINNGIDTKTFKPTSGDFRERYGLTDKKLVLGVAGTWTRSKGLDDMIELSRKLGDGYRVVLVGLTPKQSKLMPDSIIPITKTNNKEELAMIYTTSDVFVNPTYSDNYPTVNLEAQACGTPVITYRTGGSVESVPADNIVEQGDIEALCNVAKRICEGKNKDDHIIKDKDFSAEACYQNYIDLYNDIISAKKTDFKAGGIENALI